MTEPSRTPAVSEGMVRALILCVGIAVAGCADVHESAFMVTHTPDADPPPGLPDHGNEYLVRNGNRFDIVRNGKTVGTCSNPRVGPDVDNANAKIAEWAPPQRPPLPPELAAPEADIVGRWRPAVTLYESQFWDIKRNADGRYRVIYSTGGCLANWVLERTGVFRNGRLAFDSPVMSYGCRFSEAVYPIRVEGQTVLVLAAGVDALHPQSVSTLESIRGRAQFLQRVKPDDPANAHFNFLDECEEAWNRERVK